MAHRAGRGRRGADLHGAGHAGGNLPEVQDWVWCRRSSAWACWSPPPSAPRVGGWITEHYSWTVVLLDQRPHRPDLRRDHRALPAEHPAGARRRRRSTGLGIGLLAVGLGSLQYVLSEGRRSLHWFASGAIDRPARPGDRRVGSASWSWELRPANTRPDRQPAGPAQPGPGRGVRDRRRAGRRPLRGHVSSTRSSPKASSASTPGLTGDHAGARRHRQRHRHDRVRAARSSAASTPAPSSPAASRCSSIAVWLLAHVHPGVGAARRWTGFSFTARPRPRLHVRADYRRRVLRPAGRRHRAGCRARSAWPASSAARSASPS